ncbi:MAG: hypothetical protein HY544_04650 [Candidatus Diapherotrites archaeon]|uniref:Uncharacterized protein n=1 Tax=Candidatus Iainarchaeum sp. TaxID=3101447 RepID=A0A8T3YM53_9ARCH|nr:hypothetical protein [Candidatus Diapherotrites archaeon]
MLLEKPAFPAVIDEEGAKKKVSQLIRKMHWADHDFSRSTLFYVPYWLYSYDAYSHDAGKTKHISSGFGSLNAFSNEPDAGISGLVQDSGLRKEKEVPDNPDARVIPPRISEADAREIIAVRVASEEDSAKENVIVSGLEIAFVPIWLVEADVAGEKFSFRINAATGDMLNKHSVPRRRKGYAELTRELLDELSAPAGWWKYSVALVSSATNAVSSAARGGAEAHGSGNGETGHGADDGHGVSGGLSQQDLHVIALTIIAIIVILYVSFGM